LSHDDERSGMADEPPGVRGMCGPSMGRRFPCDGR
jgi:hypothetical protein